MGPAGRLYMSPSEARNCFPSVQWPRHVACRDAYGVEDLIGGYGGRYSIGSHRGFREDLELVRRVLGG